MAGPTKTWTDLTVDQYLPRADFDTTLLTNLRDNQVHLKEVAYNALSYSGGTAHDHDGTDSTSWGSWSSNNLLQNAMPSDPDSNGGAWASGLWTFDTATMPWVNFAPFEAYFKDVSDYGWQYVGGTAAQSKGLCGDGGAYVASLFVRPQVLLTQGVLDFGLADGGTGDANFISGCKASISYTELNASAGANSYQRFFARMTVGAAVTTDLRFLVRVSTAFAIGGIILTGLMLQQGSRLASFTISHVEPQTEGNSRWDPVAPAPVFSQEVALEQAVDESP